MRNHAAFIKSGCALQEAEALRQAQQGADEASAEVAAARARVAELEAEARQLRPARTHARELQERLADREQKLEKLRAEVCSCPAHGITLRALH